MSGAFKLGPLSDIDVRVHWSFLLLLAFFAFIGYQTSGSPVGALTATLTIVALFFCVLFHEFGHSLVAQRLGIEIHSITLLPIGGISNLESLPEKPADEIKITVAGPLVNVVLAPIFFGVVLLFGAVPRVPADLFTGIGSVGQFLFYLGYLNVVLAVFNLLPAFPLDGGRILRALLALAARELCVRPEECLSIEDSPAGVKAALAAETEIVAVTTDLTRQKFRDSDLLDRSHVVDDPRVLPTVPHLIVHGQPPGG